MGLSFCAALDFTIDFFTVLGLSINAFCSALDFTFDFFTAVVLTSDFFGVSFMLFVSGDGSSGTIFVPAGRSLKYSSTDSIGVDVGGTCAPLNIYFN